MPSRILEVCCFSATSAAIAEKCGAHRIEFCDNYFEGGTTPSAGNLKWAIENLSIPVFPIIRPRGGHFVYSKEEIEVIKRDILFCKELGFKGIVVGILDKEGMVDIKQTSYCCEWASPMEVTFHRAFDRVKKPFENLDRIIQSGCKRLLTSGQYPSVLSGIATILNLIKLAGESIIIMPGGGIRALNFETIVEKLPTTEFHTSALILNEEPFFSPESMNEKILSPDVNGLEIKAIIETLKCLTTKENCL